MIDESKPTGAIVAGSELGGTDCVATLARGLGEIVAQRPLPTGDDPAVTLAEIEIARAGLRLHWPKLDADPNIPALPPVMVGSRTRMPRQVGAQGGRSASRTKIAAARANRRRGGRRTETAEG